MYRIIEHPELFNSVFPITRIAVYPKGLILQRSSQRQSTNDAVRGRGRIKKLSNASLYRLVFLAANTQIKFMSLSTLTFGADYPKNGKEVKRRLNLMLTKCRQVWAMDYLWFLEFQERGAPHFHVLSTIEPTSENREQLAKMWVKTNKGDGKMYRVHNHPKSLEAIREIDGAVRYLAAYAGKPQQKTVPEDYRDVGRFWGASRSVKETVPNPTVIDVADDAEVRRLIAKKGRKSLVSLPILPKVIVTN